METIEELREQNVKLNEELNKSKAQLVQALATSKEKDARINELTTYNNKLFARLSFDEEDPQQDEEPETEQAQIDAIIKLMDKGGKQ